MCVKFLLLSRAILNPLTYILGQYVISIFLNSFNSTAIQVNALLDKFILLKDNSLRLGAILPILSIKLSLIQ